MGAGSCRSVRLSDIGFIVSTPELAAIRPTPCQALVNEDISNVAPADADGRQRPAVAILPLSIDGEPIPVEQLQQSGARLMSQLHFSPAAAYVCVGLGVS